MKQKDLIVLTIDLGAQKDEIHIKASDTPLSLSQKFCQKHNLDPTAEQAISQYISQNLLKLQFTPQASKSRTPQSLPFPIPEFPSSRLIRGKSESKKAQNSSIFKDPNTKSPEVTPGQRLYYKAVEKIKEKEEKIGKILAEREANETSGLTFRPAINTRRPSREKSKVEEEFIERHKILQEKIKTKQLEKAQDELKDCTFRPDVNRSSSKIDKIKVKDRNLHLFYSAERIRKNSENFEKNKKRVKRSGSPVKGNVSERVNLTETVERLMKYKEKYSNNIEKIKAQKIESEKFDSETGRELFKPCVNSPRTERRKNLLAGQNPSISNSFLQFSQKSVKKLVEKVKLIRYEEICKNK